MTKSEEIQARRAKYDRIERVVDELGRTIGVTMLKPSQRVRVEEMAPGLDGSTAVVDEDPTSKTFGRSFEVPKISPLIMAASVREIDGAPLTFPKNRAELDSVLDMLDSEGMAAVTEGLSRFAPKAEVKATEGDEAGAAPESPVDAAKN